MIDRNRLKDEDVKTNIDEAYESFAKFGKNYSRGLLIDQEFWLIMHKVFCEHFYDFLKNNGLRTNMNSKSWLRFQEDYALWSDNNIPSSPVGEPWLLDDNLNEYYEKEGFIKILRSAREYGIKPSAPVVEDEASVHDKSQFFSLMEAFHITGEYFEPLPEGIISPDKHWTHTYNGSCTYVIGYKCVDDGGLLAEAEPVGKKYVLINDLGLKAVVTITEDRRNQDRGYLDYDNYCPMGVYLAEGYIEGYTAIERSHPKIVIRLNEQGMISRLGIYEGCYDDQPVFVKYPLWQEYLDWCGSKEKRDKKMLSDFFDTFKNGD